MCMENPGLVIYRVARRESRLSYGDEPLLAAYVNMLGQMAACNGLHSVLERCARWLLMTQDRVNRSDFPMTHEFLAAMLGSRRSGVTVAAATLRPYKAPDTFATHMDT